MVRKTNISSVQDWNSIITDFIIKLLRKERYIVPGQRMAEARGEVES